MKDSQQDLLMIQICLNGREAHFPGPEDSPYEGGIFELNIEFPKDYPYHRPEVIFITKIYHPSIRSTGKHCFEFLWENWDLNRNISIKELLLKFREALKKEVDYLHILQDDIWWQYNRDRLEFERIAREWTKKYAWEYPDKLQQQYNKGGVWIQSGTGSPFTFDTTNGQKSNTFTIASNSSVSWPMWFYISPAATEIPSTVIEHTLKNYYNIYPTIVFSICATSPQFKPIASSANNGKIYSVKAVQTDASCDFYINNEYYLDSENNIYYKCSNNLDNCFKCTDKSTCLECNNNYLLAKFILH